jgi:hypothetical protein
MEHSQSRSENTGSADYAALLEKTRRALTKSEETEKHRLLDLYGRYDLIAPVITGVKAYWYARLGESAKDPRSNRIIESDIGVSYEATLQWILALHAVKSGDARAFNAAPVADSIADRRTVTDLCNLALKLYNDIRCVSPEVLFLASSRKATDELSAAQPNTPNEELKPCVFEEQDLEDLRHRRGCADGAG